MPPQVAPPTASGAPTPLAPSPPPGLIGYGSPPRGPLPVPEEKRHRLKTVMVTAVVIVAVLIVGVVGFFVVHGKFVVAPPYPESAKAIPATSWVRTAATDGSFSVSTPTAGAASVDTSDLTGQVVSWTDPKHPAFLAEGGNVGPHDVSKEQDALDQALTQAGNDLTVTSTLTVPFQNHAARALSGKDHGVPVRALAFFSGNSIYFLAAEGPTAVANSDTFFNSFQAAA